MARKSWRNVKSEMVVAWASAVPIVGVIPAIATFLFGLNKLKQGGLKIIGIASLGLLLNGVGTLILVPWGLRHSMTWAYGRKGTQCISDTLSQHSLHQTVKDIEYYKLVHGQYPSSLELLKGDMISSSDLYDYSAGIDGTMHQMHAYELLPDGQHYRLCSTGPDGVTGTADDIFPILSPEELAHTGYLSRAVTH